MSGDPPSELAHGESKEVPALVASLPASQQQRSVAFGVAISLSIVFAVVLPFVTGPRASPRRFLFRSIQSIICVADLIPAVLLFAQYSIQPQRALLVLASGCYFQWPVPRFCKPFLDFPRAYSATGLLSGGLSDRRVALLFLAYTVSPCCYWLCAL